MKQKRSRLDQTNRKTEGTENDCFWTNRNEKKEEKVPREERVLLVKGVRNNTSRAKIDSNRTGVD